MAANTPKDSTSGIPAAEFITDVAGYLSEKKLQCEDCVKALHVMYNKYKFLEQRLLQQKKALMQKIPDIKSTKECVEFLIKRKDADSNEFEAHYQLSDNLYAKANVDANENRVFLWLGANVMLEYDYKDARALLEKNLKSAQMQVETISTDLNFLKDQITISEVDFILFFW
mmetsp:Transcript_20524/g.36471  ORF Transcript_20524/g.36471 Transcript_20524/m.36471 type:complete len:171 (-) Transcript_20524:374-886(-)